MRINLGHGFTATWEHGSHYVNWIDADGNTYECASFAWEKDRTTFMDAWQAFWNREVDCI